MKTIYLIAPSEWKNAWWEYVQEKLSYNLTKPLDIAINAREIDLKCKWERYIEWIKLNKSVDDWPFLEAINRYSGVVFNNIDYKNFWDESKKFFEDNFFILSWMYWILKPLDRIWNYKLPVETKWLYDFWWDKIPQIIAEINPDYVVNLLPDSYAKLIWIWKCSRLKKKREKYLNWKTKIININFFKKKDWEIVKLTHWVKKYRGLFMKNICENNLTNYEQFWWKIVKTWDMIEIDIVS